MHIEFKGTQRDMIRAIALCLLRYEAQTAIPEDPNYLWDKKKKGIRAALLFASEGIYEAITGVKPDYSDDPKEDPKIEEIENEAY